MKKRLEWKKCADSGTSEKSGSHGLYWGTRVPLPAFNSFTHTFLCSVFLTPVPVGYDVFGPYYDKIITLFFLSVSSNPSNSKISIGPGHWTKTESL